MKTTELAMSRLFAGVDMESIDGELINGRFLEIQPGQILLDPAGTNADIYIVVAGELLVCLEPDPRNPLVRLGVGECVGELSIIDDRPPSAYVMPAVPSRLLAIPRETLWRILDLQKITALNLLRILAQRIRENNALIYASLELRREHDRCDDTDQLTGLHNRAWAEDVFPRQLELSVRIGQHLSLLIIDIDYFVRLNDFYGQSAGDAALGHVGQVVRRSLRLNDLCARWGGDEVAVLMPATEVALARLTADRVRGAIAANPMALPDGLNLPLTVSGGIAEWVPGQTFQALVETAMQALAQAKKAGRNQIIVAPHA